MMLTKPYTNPWYSSQGKGPKPTLQGSGKGKDCKGSLFPPYCTIYHYLSSGILGVCLFLKTVSFRSLVAPFPTLVIL